MANRHETDNLPRSEVFSTADEDQKAENVDPDELLISPSDTATDEFPLSELEEEKTDDESSTPKDGATIRRGPKFRKKLLTRIPGITYRETLGSDALDLKSWLGSVMNLKAQDFLGLLEQIVAKRDK